MRGLLALLALAGACALTAAPTAAAKVALYAGLLPLERIQAHAAAAAA